MKKIGFFLLAAFLALGFISCASNQVVTDSAAKKNNKQTEEKLRFEDWKYKGFGKELPLWVEAAVDGDLPALKKTVLELQKASNIKILTGTGENADQAEQTAKELVNNLVTQESDWILYDNFWVLEYERTINKPYISLYVYYQL